jgi:hypothetical protein
LERAGGDGCNDIDNEVPTSPHTLLFLLPTSTHESNRQVKMLPNDEYDAISKRRATNDPPPASPYFIFLLLYPAGAANPSQAVSAHLTFSHTATSSALLRVLSPKFLSIHSQFACASSAAEKGTTRDTASGDPEVTASERRVSCGGGGEDTSSVRTS